MQTRQQSKQLRCNVCFDDLTFRGKLDHCDHIFCYDCISHWAKVLTLTTQKENTCPLCKRRFQYITSIATRPLYSDRVRKLVYF